MSKQVTIVQLFQDKAVAQKRLEDFRLASNKGKRFAFIGDNGSIAINTQWWTSDTAIALLNELADLLGYSVIQVDEP